MSSCLVIIDVQNEFLTRDTDFIPDKVLHLIENSNFDYIVGTQFFNYSGSPFIRLMDWDGCMSGKAVKMDDKLYEKCDKVFLKSTYSCFTDDFIEYINSKKISKLYFVGIDTDCCVLMSAVDAFEKNLDFEVLLDYCASTGGIESHNAGVAVLKRLVGHKCLTRRRPICLRKL